MPKRLTAKTINAMEPPETGNRIDWDSDVTGLGVRVTAAGKVAFVLRYRHQGRERRMTLGGFPELSVSAARELAIKLKGDIAKGADPLVERQAWRTAPTMRDLAHDYLERHAERHKRPASIRDDRAMLDTCIMPRLGGKLVKDVSRRDIEDLHVRLKSTPYRANRVVSLLSKMFSLAVQWGWRLDNPAANVTRNPESRRERWLTTEEIGRLAAALDAYPHRRTADAIRMLLLTGARRREVLSMQWQHVDFGRGVWTKPSAHTKQKRTEYVPLSPPALALLSEIRERASGLEAHTAFVFPGDTPGKPLQDIKRAWSTIRDAAELNDVRLHDLRHTFASHLVSSGLSLPLVGRLLGHTQAATTARYAHLADDPLSQAATRFGAVVESASSNNQRPTFALVENGDAA